MEDNLYVYYYLNALACGWIQLTYGDLNYELLSKTWAVKRYS